MNRQQEVLAEYQKDIHRQYKEKIENLEKENKILRELAVMVEDNTKMPHQHKDHYVRLCCLSERARETLKQLKESE